MLESEKEALRKADPEVYEAVRQEYERQCSKLELIASENFVSPAVLQAMGSVLTNKYAEGYPKKRYYGGCEFVDVTEQLAIDRAKELFSAEAANVQPHSGSQANMAVYYSELQPGDTILAMDLAHGGHLTHGSPVNFSGKFYKVFGYGVDPKTETIDYDQVAELARTCRPKLIMCGASNYSRTIHFDRFRKVADEVGAILVADIAHIAGLVAKGLHPSPIPHCDYVTSTTHKTLRGPRGGLVLCRQVKEKTLNSLVFPGIQGGPLCHVIAAKAVAFKEALSPAFKDYCMQILRNTSMLASALMGHGFRIVSGGTDNHLFSVDLTSSGDEALTGRVAEKALDRAGITVNKNMIPFDKQSPFVASGIRIGAAALTTRGMKEPEMKCVAALVARALKEHRDEARLTEISKEVHILTSKFPLFTWPS